MTEPLPGGPSSGDLFGKPSVRRCVVSMPGSGNKATHSRALTVPHGSPSRAPMPVCGVHARSHYAHLYTASPPLRYQSPLQEWRSR